MPFSMAAFTFQCTKNRPIPSVLQHLQTKQAQKHIKVIGAIKSSPCTKQVELSYAHVRFNVFTTTAQEGHRVEHIFPASVVSYHTASTSTDFVTRNSQLFLQGKVQKWYQKVQNKTKAAQYASFTKIYHVHSICYHTQFWQQQQHFIINLTCRSLAQPLLKRKQQNNAAAVFMLNLHYNYVQQLSISFPTPIDLHVITCFQCSLITVFRTAALFTSAWPLAIVIVCCPSCCWPFMPFILSMLPGHDESTYYTSRGRVSVKCNIRHAAQACIAARLLQALAQESFTREQRMQYHKHKVYSSFARRLMK